MLKIFSKTKNINKIAEAYFSQYDNIKNALNQQASNADSIKDKHGIRLFGNVDKIIKIQIHDGIEDLKGDFTKIYESEFNLTKKESENSLRKWISKSKILPIPKFASDEFIEKNYDFISNCYNIPFVKIDNLKESEVIQEVQRCLKVRDKYFNQKEILAHYPNSKNRGLLEKAHKKSLLKLKEKEEETNRFLLNFNKYIEHNMVFKKYDLDIDFVNPDFDSYILNESLFFFNIILHLINENKIGLFQPSKNFIKLEDLEKLDFNAKQWIPYFKQFGLIVV